MHPGAAVAQVSHLARSITACSLFGSRPRWHQCSHTRQACDDYYCIESFKDALGTYGGTNTTCKAAATLGTSVCKRCAGKPYGQRGCRAGEALLGMLEMHEPTSTWLCAAMVWMRCCRVLLFSQALYLVAPTIPQRHPKLQSACLTPNTPIFNPRLQTSCQCTSTTATSRSG